MTPGNKTNKETFEEGIRKIAIQGECIYTKNGKNKITDVVLKMRLGGWYHAFKIFTNLIINLSKSEFLCSNKSSDILSGALSQQQSFGRIIEKFKKGELDNVQDNKQQPKIYSY